MMKKSFLTPVLAGVLAVTVVGSGAGYYFKFVKDADKGSDKKDGKSATAITVDQAAKNIEKQLDVAQQIVNGELEGGYSAEFTYSLPSSEYDIKDVSIAMEAKQKDKLSAVDYTVKYDSKAIISANMVYDNENENIYVKVPDLSDAYLTASMADLDAFMNSSMGGYGNDYSDVFESTVSTSAMSEFDAIADLDIGVIFTDIESYVDTVSENLPDPTDGENRKVEVDGQSCELTTKVYTITADDIVNAVNAISDKWKSDDTLKDALTTLGIEESEYDALWDDVLDDMSPNGEGEMVFEIYYYGDEVQGFNVKSSGGDGETVEGHMISAYTDDAVIVDWDLSKDDGTGITAKGALTLDGDTLNGTIKMTNIQEEYDSFSYDDNGNFPTTLSETTMEFICNDLTATDDSLVGDLTYVIKRDGSETSKLVCTFNNVGDSFDTTMTASYEGESVGTMRVTGQTTDASDITVPNGTMYNFTDETQLNQYLEGCDVEGWQESLKSSLGEELYNEIFVGMSNDYSYDYEDYSYDFDDYSYDFDDDYYEDFAQYYSDDYDALSTVV